MTDKEILATLTCIKPENYSQLEKLSKCIKIWMSDDNIDYAEEYVSTLTKDDVIDKSCSETYNNYLEWCQMNYIPRRVSVTRFNKYVSYKFNCSTVAVNGKRYYKSW